MNPVLIIVLCTAAAIIAALLWANTALRAGGATDRAEIARLRRLAEARAEQVAALGHEIRTPLAMVHGAAELLHEQSPGPLNHQQAVFVDTIRQQTTHTMEIAESLLVQARIEAGLHELHLAATDVASLARATVRDMQSIARQRNQQLVLQTPQRMARIEVDARLIRQALTNVLHNATRHTTHGGNIEVRVLDNDEEVVLSVLDDGAGMSPEERSQLFQRFASGRPLGDGTGLGMVITRQIVELHGGRVLVDTQLHRGTTVMLTLPRPGTVITDPPTTR
jgi:two-component system, OmpR family, sensor kinase